MTHRSLLILFLIFAAMARPVLAQETVEDVSPTPETSGVSHDEAPTAPTAEEGSEAPAIEAPAVDGPLFVMASDVEEIEQVHEIYQESEKTFLGFFWFWFVLIAALAGLGGLAWWIWGKREPRRAGKL